MSEKPTSSVVAIALGVVLLLCTVAAVGAATPVPVPAGTQVGLTLQDPLDATTAAIGNEVHFKVTAPVIVNRTVVIDRAAPVTGTITEVKKPGGVLNDASVKIGFLSVTAVDQKPVVLNDVSVTQAVFGGDVKLEPGHLVLATTKNSVTVDVP